jgi:hypothetical protein
MPLTSIASTCTLFLVGIRAIGWIDAHLLAAKLASALVWRPKLWTADSPLATVATELAIAYE